MKKTALISLIILLIFSFTFYKREDEKNNFIEKLLRSDTSQIIAKVMQHPKKYRLQIVYTQINRDNKGQILLHDYSYRTDQQEYFYPASMVKLPVAALVLERLNILKLNKDCLLKSATGDTSSFREKILKMLMISNNSSFNELYDFLGQEYINQRLGQLGYTDSRIIQKFVNTDTLGHRTSGPVIVLDSNETLLFRRDSIVNKTPLKNPIENPYVGHAYLEGKKLIKKPKDFSYSNHLSLTDLHKILISIIYPEAMTARQRFNLSKEDYTFLKKCMGIYPRETGNPEWSDESIYYDSFRKYLLTGTNKTRIDSTLRIFNKVGQAYGFMVDCAYIVDYKNNREFFLSAVIYTNNNEILNDGIYEYEKTGFPFLAQLGKVFYEYELARKPANPSRIEVIDFLH